MDNIDSDASSEIPLAISKHFADLVNQQCGVRSKTEAHGQGDEPDQRSNKREAQTFLRELFVAVFSDEDRYGHISDSDGDADETYSYAPKSEEDKAFQL